MAIIDVNNLSKALDSFYKKIKNNFAPKEHGTHLSLGVSSSTAFRGDYGDIAYNHSLAPHAPSNAQKNSDITKTEIEAKLTGNITSHTHNYAGSSSAGGAANSVKTNLIIKLNGGSTEGTNLFTFNGGTAKTVNITPSAIGAADSSHGPHLTLGTGSGNAYYGDKGKTAYDHSQAAHAPSNAQKNSDITKAEIEAKLTGTITSHDHNSLPTRGNVTCETGTTRPSIGGLSLSAVYNNGYPTTYGNVLSIKGQGDGQILIGWSGTSGNHAPSYIRSKRDNADANWSNWAQIYTSAFPPDANAVGAIKAISKNGYWGMGHPDGNEKEWIRTTENGIIPYQSGGYSSLGTDTWPFTNAHVTNMKAGNIRSGDITTSSKYFINNTNGQSELGVGEKDCYWYNKQAGKYLQFKNNGTLCISEVELYNRSHNIIDVAYKSSGGDTGFGDSQHPAGFIGRYPGWNNNCLYINTYSTSGGESKSYNMVKIKGDHVDLDGYIAINGTPVSVQSSAPSCGGVWIQI
jgi:hypothetical protein